MEARWRRSTNRGEEGGARRRDVRVLGVRVCAPVPRPCPRPPDPSSFRALLLFPSLCPRSRRPRGHSFVRNYRPRRQCRNFGPSLARPSSASAASIATRTSEEFAALTTSGPIRFTPGKRVLIWCPRPRPSAGPVGPAKKFQKTNGIHHLNKWFFCLKLNRRNDRPRPNPTGGERAGDATERRTDDLYFVGSGTFARSLARGGSGGGRDEKRPSRGSRARRERVHSRSLARLAVILPPLLPVASLHRLRRTAQCP